MEELKVGMILLQETCDEIQISLNGESKAINEHIEHWLVEKIGKEKIHLYNLDNQRIMTIDKDKMYLYLKGNKKFGIKPIFEISKEVA